MSASLANFLFEAANFLILAAALGWLLFRPIRAALDRERTERSKAADDLTKRQANVQALETTVNAQRAAADHDTEQRRAAIISAAQQEAAHLLDQAKQSQLEERKKLQHELDVSRQEQSVALADIVGKIAAESVQRLFAAVQGPDLDLALTRVACDGVKQLVTGSNPDGSILVESAHPLTPDTRKLLTDTLGPTFEARVVAELTAGVRITTPHGQIDASALSFAREAARHVTSAAAPDNASPGAAVTGAAAATGAAATTAPTTVTASTPHTNG